MMSSPCYCLVPIKCLANTKKKKNRIISIMDFKLLGSSTTSYSMLLPYNKHVHHRKFSSMRPVMSSLKPKTVYQDSWAELLAIKYLSSNLQAVAGITVEQDGYDGLVEVCRAVSLKYNPAQQRQLSSDALKRGIPTQFFPLLKALLPQTKTVRELLAQCSGLLFAWLVGPSEAKESELNGQREKNVVHIKKCRFLESSNCVGMCTNLCKFPSQTFLKESLGVPVTMVPNFEDMSCDMIFGEEPPAPEDDPVAKIPCYNQCKIRKRHSEDSVEQITESCS